MLKNGEVFFATPSELNDPSECRSDYKLDGEQAVWERFVHSIFWQCQVHFQMKERLGDNIVNTVFASVESITRRMRRSVRWQSMPWQVVYPEFKKAAIEELQGDLDNNELESMLGMAQWVICKKYTELLNDDHGIASFSFSALNPTMWSHYADAQKGFCIIYESSNGKIEISTNIRILDGTRPKETELGEILEIGVYRNATLKLVPVIYKKSPPKSNAFRHLSNQFYYSEEEHHYDAPQHFGESGSQFQSDHIGLVKSLDWKYEREIRAIFPTCKVANSSARCAAVDAGIIKGVIMGPRSSKTLLDQVVTSLFSLHAKTSDDRNSEYFILQADERYGTYDFEVTLKGLVGGFASHGEIPFIHASEMESGRKLAGEALAALVHKESQAQKANKTDNERLRLDR